MVQVNGRHSEALTIKRSVQQGCLLSTIFYVLALEHLLCTLKDGAANLALHWVHFAGFLRVKVFAYADDIIIFVSYESDIKTGKKVVERYEEEAGAKINFDKSEGVWLGAWTGGDAWFREPLVHWNIGLPGQIIVEGQGVWTKGERHLSMPQIQPQS